MTKLDKSVFDIDAAERLAELQMPATDAAPPKTEPKPQASRGPSTTAKSGWASGGGVA